MPIRMEQDGDASQDPQDPGRGGGGGGKFPTGLGWLALILYLFKKPKLALLVLGIAVAIWYFGGGSIDGMLQDVSQNTDSNNPFSMGASLSEERYDEAMVFEPLATSSSKNTIPSRVSLLEFAPPRGHQGTQGSCVGWASAFAARTILHSRQTGQSPEAVVFSPAYLYNQIALQGCQGSYLVDAMKSMKQNGGLPWGQFRYDERSCGRQPSSSEIQVGRRYQITGYNRLSYGASNYKTDLAAIRQNIAQGAPVVIGMAVGGTFMYDMMGRPDWKPRRDEYSERGFSGHAMCVIGYDDNRNGGSFQIMNSWGPEWGENGVAWVSYRDFDHFTKEAYGLHPMGSSTDDDTELAVSFGLVDDGTKRNLGMKKTNSPFVFRTMNPIRVRDSFKVEVTNSKACYTYVFGEETDGSSYVLFPYTPKHSAYCGIVGTRLFPKDYQMVADDLGNRDRIAIVVSKRELDYNAFNSRINAARGDYANKLVNAMANQRIDNVKFEAGQTIDFLADAKDKNLVGIVIEIDKR
ncbi:MAG: C1 family peptidase [Bacteroidota bacterium]